MGQPGAFGYDQYQQSFQQAAPAPGVAMPGGNEPPVNPVVQGPTKVNIGEALSVAITYLNKSLGAWIGAMAIFFVVLVAIVGVTMGVTFATVGADMPADATDPNAAPSFEQISSIFGLMAVIVIVSLVGSFLMQIFMYRGAFEAVDGRVVRFSSFFKVSRWGSLLGAYIVSSVISFIAVLPGVILAVIGAVMTGNESAPGVAILVLGYVLMIGLGIFVQPVVALIPLTVMDGKSTALESPVVAWRLIRPQYWMMLLASVVVSLISSAGALLFYVGMLYTVPLAMIAQVHIYRQILGGRRVTQAPAATQY
nr:hypothetical protein [Corynebacterium lactis]